MPYTMFHDRFPDIAEKETRCITFFNDPDLFSDTYDLVELYCDEPGCDCRRVMFNVISDNKKESVAVIAYGWEREDYYRKWFGENDAKTIKELKGPILNLWSPQSSLAPALLKNVKNIVLRDQRFIERLKRHYRLFRGAIEEEHRTEDLPLIKAGRNDPCPCGSGRKYKHCCINSSPTSRSL